LRNYNILPDHCDHIHIPATRAFQGLRDEEYELVEGFNGRHYLTPVKMYVLELKKSGGKFGIPIVQRVVGTQLSRIVPPRVRT
jgi:hypothetical protein